jgi:predicted acylesterase/phospholipase RssA
MSQTGIVLQGGGALGAYAFGALRRLYEQPGFRPEVVCGVSIGAINAAAVVGAKYGDPIATLTEIWARFEVYSSPIIPDAIERLVALAGNPGFFRPRLDYFNLPRWTSFYTTEPLRATLAEFIDFERINRKEQRLLVTATDIESGRVTVFDNASDEIAPEHIVASGSLPPGFPMTTIGGRAYWDGGLFDNTPLGPAIDALAGEEPRLIVINLFPGQGRQPESMLDVLDRMTEIIFSNKIDEDMKLLRRGNDLAAAVGDIESALPADSPVRRRAGFRRLRRFRKIRPLYITNREDEPVSAPFDFSRDSIARRSEAGYRDADRVLKGM